MEEMKAKANEMADKAKAAAADAAAANGIQLIVPGEQGSFAPFSEASWATLDVVVGKHKAKDINAMGSLEAEFDGTDHGDRGDPVL